MSGQCVPTDQALQICADNKMVTHDYVVSANTATVKVLERGVVPFVEIYVPGAIVTQFTDRAEGEIPLFQVSGDPAFLAQQLIDNWTAPGCNFFVLPPNAVLTWRPCPEDETRCGSRPTNRVRIGMVLACDLAPVWTGNALKLWATLSPVGPGTPCPVRRIAELGGRLADPELFIDSGPTGGALFQDLFDCSRALSSSSTTSWCNWNFVPNQEWNVGVTFSSGYDFPTIGWIDGNGPNYEEWDGKLVFGMQSSGSSGGGSSTLNYTPVTSGDCFKLKLTDRIVFERLPVISSNDTSATGSVTITFETPEQYRISKTVPLPGVGEAAAPFNMTVQDMFSINQFPGKVSALDIDCVTIQLKASGGIGPIGAIGSFRVVSAQNDSNLPVVKPLQDDFGCTLLPGALGFGRGVFTGWGRTFASDASASFTSAGAVVAGDSGQAVLYNTPGLQKTDITDSSSGGVQLSLSAAWAEGSATTDACTITVTITGDTTQSHQATLTNAAGATASISVGLGAEVKGVTKVEVATSGASGQTVLLKSISISGDVSASS